MRYCRRGPDSDVYVFDGGRGDTVRLFCTWCNLNDGQSISVDTPADMLAHLDEHITAGDRVPFYAIAELEAET